MAYKTYSIVVDGQERETFVANLTQASAPIHMGRHERGTPFQTADARHRAHEAGALLIAWLKNEGVPLLEEGENWEVR